MEDSHQKSFTVDHHSSNVEFLDTGGSEDYQGIRDQWITQCDALIFVYDISDASTLSLVQQQFCDAQTFLSNQYRQSPTTPAIPLALIGTKVDKQSEREVSEKEGRQWAVECGATFWETSAHDAKGFGDACIYLLKEMGADQDACSFTTEDSITALKQPRTGWIQSILQIRQWIPVWVCGIGTE